MDFERLPRYLLYALGFYAIFFLWALFYFFVPVITSGLAGNIMLYIYLLITSLPFVFIAIYFKGKDLKFVKEHETSIRLAIVITIFFALLMILLIFLSVM